ncbi:MAG: nuclear transport factor 2 family protein [Candidatus Nitrosocosmicus sp.]
MVENTDSIEIQIREIVDRETQAWDDKDTQKLLSIFHPDMVWPWPRTPESHNPIDGVFGMGRFDCQKWKKSYGDLFESHRLVHNVREIRKIVVSDEGDGAFAVVDVDTLWQNINTKDFHWKGRSCKIYTRVTTDGKWKMIAHTGLLDYGDKLV